MSRLPLAGKTILLFCPIFFGYEKAIQAELEAMGARVVFHSDRPKEHPWVKGYLRIFHRYAWPFADYFFFSWLRESGPQRCDIILIIRGEGLSTMFLEELRTRYPEATFVLYLWDSLLNLKQTERKFPFFNAVYSFNPVDCRRWSQIKYRPLFYLDKYLDTKPGNGDKWVFFIGTLNGDRPKVINLLVSGIGKDASFDYWLFVRSRLEMWLRRVVDGNLRRLDKARLIFKPMPIDIVHEHMGRCCAVVDIEHPNQTGLTMRTFEVIANGKKLLTTNKTILEQDFYDSSRICYIDRHNPQIPPDFLSREVKPVSREFLRKYSLRGWLNEILGLDTMVPDSKAG